LDCLDCDDLCRNSTMWCQRALPRLRHLLVLSHALLNEFANSFEMRCSNLERRSPPTWKPREGLNTTNCWECALPPPLHSKSHSTLPPLLHLLTSCLSGARSILLLSGTLAPLATLNKQLGPTFELDLDGEHVIPTSHLFWAVINKSQDDKDLTAR